MIPIFITSFYRPKFIGKVIDAIRNTRTDTTQTPIHVWDNGSGAETQALLIHYLKTYGISSLHLDSENTGCLFPKFAFHAMVPDNCEFYVVTDGDFIPSMGWLPALRDVMQANPELAMLTLDYLPRWPLQPKEDRGAYVSCEAVGNTFKMVRRSALDLIIHELPNEKGCYGDDGMFSRAVRAIGYEVGYLKGQWCYNLELTEDNWGYTVDQLKKDPRKAGYSPPNRYSPVNWETLEPSPEDIARMG